jgi:hypothetical protein
MVSGAPLWADVAETMRRPHADRNVHVLYESGDACGRADGADLILRRPTPITDATGREVAQVLHYSEVHAFPAVNRLYAGERE